MGSLCQGGALSPASRPVVISQVGSHRHGNDASLKSLNSLASLPKTMRCDEFSGPGSFSLSQGWNRWLGIVEPQIEAGALVQYMENAIQGDLRLVITRQQGEHKSRDRLTQRTSNKRGTRPLHASTHEDPVVTLYLCTYHKHRVSSLQKINLDEVGPTAKDVSTLALVLLSPLCV